MLKNAVDVKREYLVKNYPKVFNRIVSEITTAIDSEKRFTNIIIGKSEWNSFNFTDVEWFLKSYGYACSYSEDTIDWDRDVYVISVDWYLE